MRIRMIVLASLFAGCSFACIVPSVHPLYTPETLVFDPELVGDWKVDETTTWSFRPRGETAYELDAREGDTQGIFAAHLVQLGGLRFLDLRPERGDDLSFHDVHHVPVHSFARIRIDGDRFQMALLSMDWLKGQIDAGRVTVSHEIVEEDVLLTASTTELQRFVIAAAKDPEAFPDESRENNVAFTAARIQGAIAP